MAAMAAVLASPSCSSPSLSFSRRTSKFCCSSSHSSPLPRRPFLRKRHSSSSGNNGDEIETVSQKRNPGRGKDEPAASSGAFKSFGTPKKETSLVYDLREQQMVIDTGNLQGAAFLNAVAKVYCTHTAPDYSLPWQKQRQYTSTGSAFMIGDGKLLTNAHCVEHDTQVKVKRRGDDTKFVAKVLARGVECDIALLSVESEEFWRGAEPLRFGRLPCLQDSVTVVGYPFGGDTISVTKGVVSRIEVTSYAHGASDLLGIQIDAAINPGNSGGPAFNDQGECIGVAFQVFRSEDAENIGYVIPTTVVSHFLDDYERNGRYTGFPSLGVLLQKLENPALRACLRVSSNEGVLVRKVEPTSAANNVLKEGDVIVSFDDIHIGSEGTVPFRSTERIAFRYLISQKFAGDVAEIGIIRNGAHMKVQTVLKPRVHLVPYHIEGGQPSYFIIAGLVFTPLSEALIEEECEDTIGLKLLAKARYSLARFEGEEILILSQTRPKNLEGLAKLVDNKSKMKEYCIDARPIGNVTRLINHNCQPNLFVQCILTSHMNIKMVKFMLFAADTIPPLQVLANEANIGYEDMGNQQVLKLNGSRIKNIRHLAHLVDSCKEKYLIFEFEDNFLAVLEREAAATASSRILKDYGIPCERSSDLLEPYIDLPDNNQVMDEDIGTSPISSLEIGSDGLLWA